MVDFAPVKIEIYQGINDAPITPSNTKGGNISHLYAKYNELIDLVVELQNELLNQIPPETETRITTLEGNASTLDDYVSNALTDKVNFLDTSLNSRIDVINQSLTGYQVQVNQTLEEYQQSVTELVGTIPNYDGEISTMQVFLDDLQARVSALEGNPEPPPIDYIPMTDYVLIDLVITTDGLYYQFTGSGTISSILVSGATNAYDMFFDLNGNTLYANGYNTTPEGIVITFSNEDLNFAVDDTFRIYVGGDTQSDVAIEINLV